MPVLRSIIVLSITQIIAWGAMFMFVSVTAAGMADDLLLRPSAIYLGPTVMLVAMAFCSPLLAPVYARHGARLVLAFGSAAAAPGLWLLAGAGGPVSYFAAWGILGLAGAAALTTSAQVFLTEIAGEGARRAIGAQMLAMALAPTIAWPVTTFCEAALGWRGTFVLYGAVMLLVCAPLHFFRLAQTRAAETQSPGPQFESVCVAGCCSSPVARRCPDHGGGRAQRLCYLGLSARGDRSFPQLCRARLPGGRLRIGHRFHPALGAAFRFPRRQSLGRVDDGPGSRGDHAAGTAGARAWRRGGMVDHSLPRALWPFKRRHVRQPGDDAARLLFLCGIWGRWWRASACRSTSLSRRPRRSSPSCLARRATGGRWRSRFSAPSVHWPAWLCSPV
ncbi:MFS transporter [Sinorhizobium meliloti]|nr:MFS transporter [Sinorhizobium meliloti]